MIKASKRALRDTAESIFAERLLNESGKPCGNIYDYEVMREKKYKSRYSGIAWSENQWTNTGRLDKVWDEDGKVSFTYYVE